MDKLYSNYKLLFPSSMYRYPQFSESKLKYWKEASNDIFMNNIYRIEKDNTDENQILQSEKILDH